MAIDYEKLRRGFEGTPFGVLLGMRHLEIARGYARVEMVVRPEHANFHGWTHGGLIMALADQAFGCATNSYGPLYVSVQFNMNLIASPRVGDTLTAEARVLHAGRRTGVAEVSIQNQTGRLIARASGTVVGLTEHAVAAAPSAGPSQE